MITLPFLLVACVSHPLLPVLRTTASINSCQGVQRRPSAPDTIVGGKVVNVGDPDETLVTMLTIRRGEKEAICTGTLLSDRVVLTAAHCVVNTSPGAVTARFLTKEGCPHGQRRPFSVEGRSIVLHKEFDGTPTSRADVAILELAEPAPEDHQRLKLVDEANPPTGEVVTLLGFGITREDQKDSQTLRRIDKILAEDFQFRERDLLIDQTSGKGGFCRGDSGAPVLAEVYGEKRVIGVNSANVGIAKDRECQTLSIAMRTGYFREWILGQQRRFDSRGWFGRWMAAERTSYE